MQTVHWHLNTYSKYSTKFPAMQWRRQLYKLYNYIASLRFFICGISSLFYFVYSSIINPLRCSPSKIFYYLLLSPFQGTCLYSLSMSFYNMIINASPAKSLFCVWNPSSTFCALLAFAFPPQRSVYFWHTYYLLNLTPFDQGVQSVLTSLCS